MAYKTDETRYRIYARHGDMCTLGKHHDSLHCASGHKAEDYVLVAQFAYLMEAIDYAQAAGNRGVNTHLRSRRYGQPGYDVSRYPYNPSPAKAIAEHVTSTLTA
jgi:hypothetical protein